MHKKSKNDIIQRILYKIKSRLDEEFNWKFYGWDVKSCRNDEYIGWFIQGSIVVILNCVRHKVQFSDYGIYTNFSGIILYILLDLLN